MEGWIKNEELLGAILQPFETDDGKGMTCSEYMHQLSAWG